jgi:hypothetical protein
MLADLGDIGKPGIRPFLTNNNLTLTLSNGQKLKTGSAAQQDAEMLKIQQEGSLGAAYNAVFTTYSQLQTVNDGKEPFRREFFRSIAPKSIFIFDEAHEAEAAPAILPGKAAVPHPIALNSSENWSIGVLELFS